MLGGIGGEASNRDFAVQRRIKVQFKWPVDSSIFSAIIGNNGITVQMVAPLALGYQLIHYGSKFDVLVRTPKQAELATFMPKLSIIDFSHSVRSPMPGLVVSVKVKKGDKVTIGQELAVVEAMKMQNVLRAERDGIIDDVTALPGANVGVDEVLLTFKK